MLASDDIHLGLCFSTNSLWSTRYFKVLPNVGRVKSSVDDLTMERGTVSMRVAFVLRSAEVQPLFRDLCDAAPFTTTKRTARCRILPPIIALLVASSYALARSVALLPLALLQAKRGPLQVLLTNATPSG